MSAKIYRCSIQVRGYELDSYGHVNHAVYVSYLEHARWLMLQEEQITLEKLNEWKRWPVIAEIQVKYLKPAFMSDQLDITTQITGMRRVGFALEQKIFRGEEQILQASIGSVIVNEQGRPAELTDEIKALWPYHTHRSA